MRLLTLIFLALLVSCSQETDVITGPFVFNNDITYDQNTNEPITGTILVLIGALVIYIGRASINVLGYVILTVGF